MRSSPTDKRAGDVRISLSSSLNANGIDIQRIIPHFTSSQTVQFEIHFAGERIVRVFHTSESGIIERIQSLIENGKFFILSVGKSFKVFPDHHVEEIPT